MAVISDKYPIGEQSFSKLREEGYLYVDKTRFIEKLVEGSKYYFLGRPRRFGKSLFLSTLKCFFEGRRDLFSGLYVDSMDWDWNPYPVFYLDLNVGEYTDETQLNLRLHKQMDVWQEQYGVRVDDSDPSSRFESMLRMVSLKYNKGVVILVDEYDKPLVNSINKNGLAEIFRRTLASVYSNFKSGADYIRMVFLTGVSRFGHLSVFSGLNNIRDISFEDGFSDICGITENELICNFSNGIRKLADKRSESEADVLKDLKTRYDGYRFSENGIGIYNPFSILNALASGKYADFWIKSGQPTLLVELIRRCDTDLRLLITTKCKSGDIDRLDYDSPSPVAILYQTGYLTIIGYDDENDIYELAIPNREVKEGFFQYLLPYYANLHGETSSFYVLKFVDDLRSGDAESFMRRIKSFFASVSYDMEMEKERNLHNALLVLVSLLGLSVKAELRTSYGRIDLYISTDKYNYIIELKLDGSPEEALSQIESRQYALPYLMEPKQLILIGADFSSRTRTLSGWLCREV